MIHLSSEGKGHTFESRRLLVDWSPDFADAVDSAGYQVASHDRSNAFRRTCHDEVSGREHHRFRYEGNDFRHAPDQFGYIRILFHDTVYRQPQPALVGWPILFTVCNGATTADRSNPFPQSQGLPCSRAAS